MQVQTQVIDQSQLTAQDLNLQARVDDFKSALAEIRASRVKVVEDMRGLTENIRNLSMSRANALGMFQSEASQMYPELVVKDMNAFLQSIPSNHPVMALWKQYDAKIAQIDSNLATETAQFDLLNEEQAALAKEEEQTLSMYGLFAQDFKGAVPAPTDLMNELQTIEVIPVVESGDVQIRSALQILDPEAQAMVINQAVSMETGYDAHAVNENLTNDMPMMVQKSLIDTVGDMIPGEQSPKFKVFGLALVIFGAFYIFGGKEK